MQGRSPELALEGQWIEMGGNEKTLLGMAASVVVCKTASSIKLLDEYDTNSMVVFSNEIPFYLDNSDVRVLYIGNGFSWRLRSPFSH